MSGWILAYYQWYSEKKFKEIEAGLPVREVVEMYPALHEAPEDKFVEAADRIIRRKEQGKTRCGGSGRWRDIPKGSFRAIGVTLRSIQQYEQGKEDSKASAETVRALARSLGCQMEDLL